jgi:hypothetical protein
MPRNELLEELINALQVLAVLSSHVRRTTGDVEEDAVQIEAAVDRAINVVKRIREGSE